MEVDGFRPQRQPLRDPLEVWEEQKRLEEEAEKKRKKQRAEDRVMMEEAKYDKLRSEMRKKAKEMTFERPVKYKPQEPVVKSVKLKEWESSIQKGTFLDDAHTREVMQKARNQTRTLKYMKALSSAGVDDDFGMKVFGFK